MVSRHQLRRADLDQYSISTIRDFLRDAFTVDKLWRFCQERSDFRSILADCGPNPSMEEVIDALIEHCRTQVLFEELFSEIQAINPKQFARYHMQLYTTELTADISRNTRSANCDLPPVTVLLDSRVSTFTQTERESFVLMLSRFVDVNPEQVHILQFSQTA